MAVRRSLRLQGKKNFSRVYKEGSVVRSDYVVVYFLPASEQKVAVVVSKRFGNAVKRNRIRRLLLEAWQENHDHLPSGYYIILPRSSLLSVEENVWRNKVKELFHEWQSASGKNSPHCSAVL